MTKRTRKQRAAKAARKSRGKMGGVRPGSGPKPKLGADNKRIVIKTVRLSTGEHEAQLAAVKRSGAKDWAEWARGLLNLQAGESARAAAVKVAGEMMPPSSGDAARPIRVVTFGTGTIEMPPTPPAVNLHPEVAAGMRPISLSGGAVVAGTDPCVCGHAPEEHGHDPAHLGSTACRADLGAEGCDCAAYEADHDELAEAAP